MTIKIIIILILNLFSIRLFLHSNECDSNKQLLNALNHNLFSRHENIQTTSNKIEYGEKVILFLYFFFKVKLSYILDSLHVKLNTQKNVLILLRPSSQHELNLYF